LSLVLEKEKGVSLVANPFFMRVAVGAKLIDKKHRKQHVVSQSRFVLWKILQKAHLCLVVSGGINIIQSRRKTYESVFLRAESSAEYIGLRKPATSLSFSDSKLERHSTRVPSSIEVSSTTTI